MLHYICSINMLSYCTICICDWACENRAYLHTKSYLIFELQLTISFEVQKLWPWNFIAIFINQYKCKESSQNMNILSADQEKYHFLNMCNLCRYARFSQAQSHILHYMGYTAEKKTLLTEIPPVPRLHWCINIHIQNQPQHYYVATASGY